MTQDDKIMGILERIQNLPEGQDLPEDIFNDLTQDEVLAIYVEKMLEDKGEELTVESLWKHLTALNDEINKQMIIAMPEYLAKNINEAMDKGADVEEVNKMISESGIDVETITEKAMNDYRERYLNGEEK